MPDKMLTSATGSPPDIERANVIDTQTNGKTGGSKIS